jgi:primosomal protein N'
LRFDFDSIKSVGEKKDALEKIQKADIIIGTKMIST